MIPRTPIEPVTEAPSGVARATDESRLTPELIERIAKLDPTARPRPSKILSLPPDESEGTPEEIHQSCREEILRRLESIQAGTAKFYTVEETLAHLDEHFGPDWESRPSLPPV